MKTITVVELNNIDGYPPVQNLIRVLLNKKYKVNLIGKNVEKISSDILECEYYVGYETAKYSKPENIVQTLINRVCMTIKARELLKTLGNQSDYIWTTSMKSVQILRKRVLAYRNILQLMELAEHGYLLHNHFKFPIDKYARLSWKTVVPEINRAYIQKVWWGLPSVPMVLPNKPYSNDYGEVTDDLLEPISIMKKEQRKILLYLGVIGLDRDLEKLAKAVQNMDGYALYIVGRVYSDESQNLIDRLQREYNCIYLGGFHPPKHLALVQYAHIGLLPYKPVKFAGLSDLNALYCAPNKIFEYSGFGVPMVGSDVLGLRLPFEKWDIGRCCDFNDADSVIKAVEEVDRNHDEMGENCRHFYDSVDLDKIVSEILEDEA